MKPQGQSGRCKQPHLSRGIAQGGSHTGTLPGNPQALVRKHGHQVSLVQPFQPLLVSPLQLSEGATDNLVVKINQ